MGDRSHPGTPECSARRLDVILGLKSIGRLAVMFLGPSHVSFRRQPTQLHIELTFTRYTKIVF